MSGERRITAEVWTSDDGAPVKFIYRGRRFTVISRPVHWIGRRDRWWEGLRRIPQQNVTELLERDMFQVEAQDIDDGEVLHFDLESTEGREWPVDAVWE